jgi:hypothetical protein
MHSHFAGDVGQYLMAVFQFYTEHGIRQRFHDRTFYLNHFFFVHAAVSTSLSAGCAAVARNCGYPLDKPAVVQWFPAGYTPSNIFEIDLRPLKVHHIFLLGSVGTVFFAISYKGP